MAIAFDGVARIIQLDSSPIVSIPVVYSRWVDWVAQGDNSKFLLAASVVADPPVVPVYLTLINGWQIRLFPGEYTITFEDGFLYRDGGGDPIAPTIGIEPRVRYRNPVIAVGYNVGGSSLTSEEHAALMEVKRKAKLIPAAIK